MRAPVRVLPEADWTTLGLVVLGAVVVLVVLAWWASR
jgi:hypothetical protein